MPANYRPEDLRGALASLPLASGDVLFCHSNIGFFGRMEGVANTEAICEAFLEEIMSRIEPGGTLVVPTFTYSFPRGEVFDIAASRSGMGSFSEYLRRRSEALRSCDPCYSVAAVGAHAVDMTSDVSTNSFDDNSFFSRFFACGGKVLNLNFDAGSTFIHYVERKLGVPYRFDKTFSGIVRQNGVERRASSTIWVRYLSDDSLEAVFEPFDAIARAEGSFAVARLGRGEIGTISAQATADIIARTLPKRPWFLTKAEQIGISAPRIVPED
jgi:aminoglycoside 3-N-acetyltransferase